MADSEPAAPPEEAEAFIPLICESLAPAPPMHARKVLFLHGWCQNATVFRSKMHPWVKRLKGVAGELVFCSAPHEVPQTVDPATGELTGRPNARGWWRYAPLTPEEEGPGADPLAKFRRPYTGWPLSRSYLARLWAEHGPFEGIVGFSQGAVVLHQLAAELQLRRKELAGDASAVGVELAPELCSEDSDWRAEVDVILGGGGGGGKGPKWGIAVCGFPAPLAPDTGAIELPCLHVVGVNDTTVPPSLQHELSRRYAPAGGDVPRVLEHDRGHAMPQRAGEMKEIVSFINTYGAPSSVTA